MEYDWANPRKKKSDIKILERIAEDKGFPDEVIKPVSEFLAERIEMIDGHYVCYSRLKKGIKRITSLADHLIEKNPEGASILYTIAGKNSLGLAGKLNDENFVKQAKGCFSSIIECYKKLIENLDKGNENKKEKYEFFSKEYEFLSDNAFQLKEVLNIYFKKRKNTENLINSAYEPFFSLSKSEDYILDELNRLNEHLGNTNNINYVKLKDSIIKIQEQAECLELDSNNINQTLKKILITKGISQLKNRLENLL